MTKFDPYFGISQQRRRNLSSWMHAHLQGLADKIDAATARAETAEASLAGVARDRDAAQFNYEQKSADFEACYQQLEEARRRQVPLLPERPEPYDHTVADFDQPGRFQGDYRTSLSFKPLTDSKYRWRVSVGVWVEKRYTARGHAEGYKDEDYWGEPNSILHEYPSQSFKTSEKALTYLLKVRAAADRMAIERRLEGISAGQKTVIA